MAERVYFTVIMHRRVDDDGSNPWQLEGNVVAGAEKTNLYILVQTSPMRL